jgi:small GTP-binding protein
VSAKLKVCMLGATGVGKTSLVARYVSSVFSDSYRTTIGVKIEEARVRFGDGTVDVLLWDLTGEDEFQSVRLEYLRGASGYLLVIDGTRRETVDVAIALQQSARRAVGDVPFVVVVNKADLRPAWDVAAPDLAALAARGWRVRQSSAKTGDGVQAAFEELVTVMVGR